MTKLCFGVLVLVSACGPSLVSPPSDAEVVDSAVAADAGMPDGSVIPLSYCFDGVSTRTAREACHCVRVCDLAQSYRGYYLCSSAPADNELGQGNQLGMCLDGRCLDTPFGFPCP